jgi:hypothetical protein
MSRSKPSYFSVKRDDDTWLTVGFTIKMTYSFPRSCVCTLDRVIPGIVEEKVYQFCITFSDCEFQFSGLVTEINGNVLTISSDY